MALTLSIPVSNDLTPRITVIGVGGAGGNAVNNMIENQLEGCEFIVANTDHQALQQSRAGNKLQLGARVTEGLGAGARPEVGAAAAEESIEEIVDRLVGCHMCFITAGMGGGTGTGAAPIIARAAREMGILTVGVVTKPFQFEGGRRMKQAESGLDELQQHVDTLIIIPNQNLFRIANEKTTFTEAFALADDVLYQGVKGVTDLMVRPGIINLDFADVRSVMNEMGKAMMGTGESSGEDRSVQAAEKAIANPLLDEISLKGARGVLINVTAGPDLTLFELDEAANRIRAEVDPDANIMVGSTLDPEMTGMMRVSVVATGIDALGRTDTMPLPRKTGSETVAQTPQAARDSSYQVVAFRAVRIWPGRDEGYWVYTEQQIEGQERPYRQRIQRYFRDEQGDIRLRVYTFPQTSEHIGDWQSPERFDSLDPTVLSAEAGCDNLYRQVEPGVFAGSTIDEQCRNTWRGAAFMRSVSSVTATGFTNWDRGFTEEGEHVWGPRGGGYEFTKLSDL